MQLWRQKRTLWSKRYSYIHTLSFNIYKKRCKVPCCNRILNTTFIFIKDLLFFCFFFFNLMHFTSRNCKCTLYINISLIRLLQFGTYSYFKEVSGDRLEQKPTNYLCILLHSHPSQKWKALVYKIQAKGGNNSVTGSLNPYNLSWLFSWVQCDKEQP